MGLVGEELWKISPIPPGSAAGTRRPASLFRNACFNPQLFDLGVLLWIGFAVAEAAQLMNESHAPEEFMPSVGLRMSAPGTSGVDYPRTLCFRPRHNYWFAIAEYPATAPATVAVFAMIMGIARHIPDRNIEAH